MTTTITLYKTIEGVTPIRVGRRILVSGLDWQVLPSGQNYMHEARKIARQERERTGKTLDVVILRRHTDVVQAGMVVRGGRGRVRKGTFALAAVAADVLGPTFIAAFALPDGRYALTAAIHNAIVPDSDGVYEESDARQRMQDLWNSLSGSQAMEELQIFGPREIWPEAKPFTFEELLGGIKRNQRLRHPTQFASNSRSTWLAWSVVALVCMAGWWGWEAYQAREQQRLAHQRAQELERLRLASGQNSPDASLMRPWTYMASLPEFLRVCNDEIGQTPLTLDGWVLLSVQCDARVVSASFARTEGRTVDGFSTWSQAWRPDAKVSFNQDGDLATVRTSLSMSAAGDEGLAPMESRINRFMSWWQHRLIPFEAKPIASTLAPNYLPASNVADPKAPQPNWKTIRWSIKDTQRAPSTLLGAEFNHDGVRLQEIKLTFGQDGKLNWSLQGELYGN